MKKYRIHDEDGSTFDIEEIVDEEVVEAAPEEVVSEEAPMQLSDEEVAALKRLASVADKLVALVAEDEAEEAAEEVISEDEEAEEQMLDEEPEDIVIDTEEEVKGYDSMASFGSLEAKKESKKTTSEDVNNAWIKRYGGQR